MRLPYITEEELQDKSKSDTFVRTIAIVQLIWIGVQIVVRAVRRLAVSQLEIAVIAFAACAIIIYGLNWYKPKGVQTPITLLVYPGEAPYGLHDALRRADKRDQESVVWLGDFLARILRGAR